MYVKKADGMMIDLVHAVVKWHYLLGRIIQAKKMKVHKMCLNNGCIWQTQNIVNLNLKQQQQKTKNV